MVTASDSMFFFFALFIGLNSMLFTTQFGLVDEDSALIASPSHPSAKSSSPSSSLFLPFSYWLGNWWARKRESSGDEDDIEISHKDTHAHSQLLTHQYGGDDDEADDDYYVAVEHHHLLLGPPSVRVVVVVDDGFKMPSTYLESIAHTTPKEGAGDDDCRQTFNSSDDGADASPIIMQLNKDVVCRRMIDAATDPRRASHETQHDTTR